MSLLVLRLYNLYRTLLALQRAKMFLPMLKQSNIEIEEKAKEDPNSVIIENVNGEDPHYSLIVCHKQ